MSVANAARLPGFCLCAMLFGEALAGCVEATNRDIPLSGGLLFVLTFSSPGGPLRSVRGPFESTRSDALVGPVYEGESQLLLELDLERLLEEQPVFSPSAWPGVTIQAATLELSVCGVEGYLHDEQEIELPLDPEFLGEGTMRVHRLHPVVGTEEPPALPAGLSVRLPVATCGAKSRLVFTPFGADAPVLPPAQHERFASVEAISILDPEHVVIFSHHGLVFVRRNDRGQPGAGAKRLAELIDLEVGGIRWSISHGEVFANDWPREAATVIVALTGRQGVRGNDVEQRGGWLRLSLSPEGTWSLEDRGEVLPRASRDRGGFRHVYFEESGRYFVAGREMVLTATAPRVRPTAKTGLLGFEGRATVALGEPGAPHLVVGDASQAFEGDVFDEDFLKGAYSFGASASLRFLDVAELPEAPGAWVATGSDQLLWRRVAPRQWSQWAYSLPNAANTCVAKTTGCGRRPSVSDLKWIISAPGGRGVFFSTRHCTGVFWKRANEVCAAAGAPSGWPLHANDMNEVSGFANHGNLSYVVTSDWRLYTLDLVED